MVRLALVTLLGLSALASAFKDVLHFGPASSVDMDPKILGKIDGNLTEFNRARDWGSATDDQIVPIEPGSTTLIARKGVIVHYSAVGECNLWASVDGSDGEKLPPHEQQKATRDTIYDAASLTKMFTTIVVLRCVDADLFQLSSPVSSYLPDFASNGKENITVLQLLTHTSGLPAGPTPTLLHLLPTYEDRITAILNQTLPTKPGTEYLYSDMGFMTLMLLVEKATSKRLDELTTEVTTLLEMESTFYNRGNQDLANPLIAPTEFQLDVVGDTAPKRPQPVRATVHDEQAFSLQGVSGHAGIFTTAMDVARLCHMLVSNGTYHGNRVLSQSSIDAIYTDWTGQWGLTPGRGAGFELNQEASAGPMANPQAASHTGFTGTSLVADRESGAVFVHMAHRVHPSRDWSSNTVVRQTVGAWVATALGRIVEFPAIE